MYSRIKDTAWPSQYIVATRNAPDEYKLTPEGIEALKNG